VIDRADHPRHPRPCGGIGCARPRFHAEAGFQGLRE